MTLYTVETYDVSDDPRKDGAWTVFAEAVLPEALAAVLENLYARGYSAVSIDVTDQDGERLEDDDWPSLRE